MGTRPFAGRTAKELLDAIDGARIAAPPRGRMPAWVERALRKGLTTTERFGSLDELLDVLSRDPARSRRRRLWIGLGVIGIAAAFVSVRRGRATRIRSAGDPGVCSRHGRCDAHRSVRSIASTGVPTESRWRRPRGLRRDYDSRWTHAHRDACLAHARGEHPRSCSIGAWAACIVAQRSRNNRDARSGGRSRRAAALALAARSLPRPEDCGDLERIGATTEPCRPSGAFAERLQAERSDTVRGTSTRASRRRLCSSARRVSSVISVCWPRCCTSRLLLLGDLSAPRDRGVVESIAMRSPRRR